MNNLLFFTTLLLVGSAVRFVLTPQLESGNILIQAGVIFTILTVGAFYLLRNSAKVIEETTEVLSERTKLAGGLLQSLGTAFPDMILGIVAALVSVRLQNTDYERAVTYAIIAASTTFGSNIYNIAHAAWCMYRQNRANALNTAIYMFPGIPAGGTVIPIAQHSLKPHLIEFDTAIQILISLTLLTSAVAISMVFFGRVELNSIPFSEDLYQLIRPIGAVIFLISGFILYLFRKTQRKESGISAIAVEEQGYRKQATGVILFHLLLAGIVILFAAESMIHAIEILSHISQIPPVVAGTLAGLIGCLGEMLVIHNYTVNPKGRIGDALIGVGMDNIVTTAGAAIVAMMGGIFLGGSSLIVIFVLILGINTILIGQVSQMKNYYLRT
jgi:hypothetical protein